MKELNTKLVIKTYHVKEELKHIRDTLKTRGCPMNATRRVELGAVTTTLGIDLYLLKRILNTAKAVGITTYTSTLSDNELILVVGGITTYTINLHKLV